MINQTAIIPWHEFKYMPIEMIKNFCKEHEIKHLKLKNTLKSRRCAWQIINWQYYFISLEKYKPVYYPELIDKTHKENKVITSEKKRARRTYRKPEQIQKIITDNYSIFSDLTLSDTKCGERLGMTRRVINKYRFMHNLFYDPKVVDRGINSYNETQKKAILNSKLTIKQCACLTGISRYKINKLRKELNIRTHAKKRSKNLQQ